MINRNPFPQPGELVVCRVTNVQKGYIQVELEDYKGLPHEEHAQGMVHVSELSSRWVKNISSIVSTGQRVVLQVLRVNEEKGYVDLSLRRVTKMQRTQIMNNWRYITKLEGMLNFFAEKHGMTIHELYEKAIWALIDKFGDIRTAFEDIKENGTEFLQQLPNFSLNDAIRSDLINFINDNTTISKVNITVEFDIRSTAGNGIVLIKETLLAAMKLRKPKEIEATFSYIGAPVYRCDIEAKDYPTAERHLAKIVSKIQSSLGSEGTIDVIRDKLSNKQSQEQV